jgi:hypothetical protein
MLRRHPRLLRHRSSYALIPIVALLTVCGFLAGALPSAWGQTPPCLVDLSLDTVHTINGVQVTMPVVISTQVQIGGFDLLLCYDPVAVAPLSIAQGAAIQHWEYFTYRLSSRGNCGTGCPSGLLRIVALADMDNGPGKHPPAGEFAPDGIIAQVTFNVTTDRNYIGFCIPVTFCWLDCGDNVVASRSGDTTFVDRNVAFDTCQSHPKGEPVPGLCTHNGLICIDAPPDDRGDINLNGIANEIGDAVLFTNYFIYGNSVWSPIYRESQILATDINDDGLVLTVADLIYLIRIISGDAQPFPPTPKRSPYVNEGEASFRLDGGRLILSTSSPVELGGVLLVVRYSGMAMGQPSLLDAASGMRLRADARAGESRILVYPDWEGANTAIASGTNEIVSVPVIGDGQVEITEVQLSDRNGSAMLASSAKSSVPAGYDLLQNYPNPFNAGTVMTFTTTDDAAWSLTIYNIVGQAVRRFDGSSGPGRVSVPWDGTDASGTPAASGIYLYRVSARGFTATKKMTLVR